MKHAKKSKPFQRAVLFTVEGKCYPCGGLVSMTLASEVHPGDDIPMSGVIVARVEPINRRYIKGTEKPCSCKPKKGKK